MAADPQIVTAISNSLSAIAALGVAAYGLADATKIGRKGGISNAGFTQIMACVAPFEAALAAATDTWRVTLHSHWVNGTALAEQKALAKSLIRLGLNPTNAARLAPHGHVDPVAFTTAVTHVFDGTALTPQDLAVLGRFDASVDTALDAGYERADQRYRNCARVLAGVIAIVLAVAGGWMLSADRWAFWTSLELLRALLIGAVSVPLAPIAKDLASSLAAAVSALKISRGV
jgi:hypothetical protein